MDMTPERWENTSHYLQEVFGREDAQLRTLMTRAVAAGLPDIAVSAEVGRLLKLLAMTPTREPRSRGLILELGTLAGYSGIWLARGLPPGGRLITVEFNPVHAAFAQKEFEAAGVARQVRVVTGAALDVLPKLARELGPESIDLAFVDAVKTEYSEYFRLIKPLLRPGGFFLADNALGSSFWIDDEPGSSPERDAVDAFNRMVAGDREFEAACVPIRQGVLVARKMESRG
jgi:caffeoyl-CoA O-methyltransferase